MDFRHLIVTCLFSMLRLSFETQKIKENYAILKINTYVFLKKHVRVSGKRRMCFLKVIILPLYLRSWRNPMS